MSQSISEQQRKQNLFDATWATALTMTEPAIEINPKNDLKKCWYTQPETGNHCFIGARIPAALYDPKMDAGDAGIGVNTILLDFPILKDYFIEQGWTTEQGFLSQLQSIHDDSFDKRFSKLQYLANQYDLSAPALPATV